MKESNTASAVLRPKRQVTLPKEICEKLGIKAGDTLELTVEDSVLVAKPRKKIALDALREIREAFARSGISEEELLDTARQVRKEIIKERYGVES